jgi:hypothetical protein
MKLFFRPTGQVEGLYSEAIDARAIGRVTSSRASHVEPDPNNNWIADLSPVGGPVLGPFAKRSEALAAESGWLDQWLADGKPTPCSARAATNALAAHVAKCEACLSRDAGEPVTCPDWEGLVDDSLAADCTCPESGEARCAHEILLLLADARVIK